MPAAQTEFFVNDLVDRCRDSIEKGDHHPVLLTGLFALDLLVIHPFEDGNGRVARAVTNALLDSTHNWHDGDADPWPWLTYFVETLAKVYAVFAQRAAAGRSPGTKQDRVREHVLRHAPAHFSVADLRTALPGASDQTIRLVVADGAGRSATWRRLERR